VYKQALAAIFVTTMLGCAHKKPIPLGDSFSDVFRANYEMDADGSPSLFRGDSEVLSDAEIARILSYQIDLSGKHRLAVLQLSRKRLWSEDHARQEQGNISEFLARLRSSAHLTSVSQLPSLLVPQKTTVPYLREAAARSQADLLLVFDTSVRSFTKYRAVGKDEVRVLCAVDAVLVDVRTGIVPFTASKSEELVATRTADDFNFAETVAKAVVTTEGRVLSAIAVETATFLDGKT
jgi:hypothetical protein